MKDKRDREGGSPPRPIAALPRCSLLEYFSYDNRENRADEYD